MRIVSTFVCITAIIVFFRPTSSAGETAPTYVSDDELKTEIDERAADMKRTQARLAELLVQEQAASVELAHARKNIGEIESQTALRVRAFYLMSRNAGSLKFLLEAESPTDAIRRAATLRRVLLDGLDARRSAGLRIAEAEKNLSRVNEDKEAAGLMLQMLEEAYDSRVKEAASRHISIRRFHSAP